MIRDWKEIKSTFFKKEQNLLTGTFFALFSVICFLQCKGLSQKEALIPEIMLFIIAISGSYLAIATLILKSKNDEKETADIKIDKMIILEFILLVVLWFVLAYLGFYISLFLFITTYYFMSVKVYNTIEFLKGGLFSAASVAVLYLIFDVGLKIVVPRGVLF